MKPIVIQTERLILRPVELEDCASLWEDCFSDWQEFRGQCGIPSTGEELKLWLRKIIADYEGPQESLVWCMATKEDNTPIGIIDFHGKSVGYNLAPVYRGMGYMTEAVKSVVGYAFAVRERSYVTARCKQGNVKSIGVLERCGFKRYGFCVDNYIDGPEGTYKYILFREDWHA